MKNTPLKTEDLLVMLQCCHSVLSTAWPRPDAPSLSGAGIFISTNVFTALQNADKELCHLFQESYKEGLEEKYVEAWEYCHKIISSLKQMKTKYDHPSVDQAFNLLYLATGVLYQEISVKQIVRPKQDERFSTVEHLNDLVKKCDWKIKIEKDLVEKLNSRLKEMSCELGQ